MSASLAVIDPDGSVSDQLETLERACRQLGFFRIPLAAVAAEVRDAAWEDAARFFALPEERKLAVEFPEPGYPYGYSPYRYETLAAAAAAAAPPSAPDLKESLSVGPDCLGPPPPRTEVDDGSREPAVEAWLHSPSLWPSEPAGLRASWSAYFGALTEVSARLLSMMAVALDLPADHFEPLIDRGTAALRAVHYPALDRAVPAGALRAGAHSDYGTLTILRTDGVPGLEVLGPDGGWVPVADEPGTFVVNLGDSIAQWTNDRWRSTVHRVTNASSAARQSMAYFHMANWDARIECLPTCLAPGEEPRYEPVLAGPWLMSKFQRTVG